jgi:hypothetical protein
MNVAEILRFRLIACIYLAKYTAIQAFLVPAFSGTVLRLGYFKPFGNSLRGRLPTVHALS